MSIKASIENSFLHFSSFFCLSIVTDFIDSSTIFYLFFFFIGHYYGTPRPPKEPILTNGQHQYLPANSNNNQLRRSNSANEMFQQQHFLDNGPETSNGKETRIIIKFMTLFFNLLFSFIQGGGMHYQYPNNDPEFFIGHSPNEQMFHPSNTDNQTSASKKIRFVVIHIKHG